MTILCLRVGRRSVSQRMTSAAGTLCIAGFALATLISASPLCAAQAARPNSRAPRIQVSKPPVVRAGKPAANPPAPAAKPAETPVTVTVRPNCEVAGATFTLAEIADIQGDDKALKAQLAAVEIGASPLPGLSRIINPGDVTVRLRQYRLESARVELVLPPGIRIARTGHDIASDEITRAAMASAKDAIKNLPDANLEPITPPAKLVVPAGTAQILAGAWRGNPDSGVLTVPVSVLVDGKPVQSVDVTLRVHRKITAVVARHDIQPHDILTAQDVVVAAIDLNSITSAPITAIEDAIGKRATRRIAGSAAIGADMLEKAPLIAANDTVTIEFLYGALRVTATGVARQAGAEGDRIHVYAPDTRKELDGIVIDSHTVRVEDSDSPNE